jgi:Na+-transporting NADH:ubiquinone oxidoreductase subunit F
MAKETYRARVLANRLDTAKIHEIDVALVEPPEFHFKAGQFVTVPVAEKTLRSYSIASPPTDPTRLLLIVDIAPAGPGARYFQELKAGDDLLFQGPYGAFCLRPDTDRDLILVATGSGIAPVRGMLRDLCDQRDMDRAIVLFFGCRHREDLIFHEEFVELARQYPGFVYHPTLSQPAAGSWGGMTGRVTAHLAHYLPSVDGRTAFVCGSKAMLKDVGDILVGLGMDKKKIKKEQFF